MYFCCEQCENNRMLCVIIAFVKTIISRARTIHGMETIIVRTIRMKKPLSFPCKNIAREFRPNRNAEHNKPNQTSMKMRFVDNFEKIKSIRTTATGKCSLTRLNFSSAEIGN